MAYCLSCGHSLAADAQFCSACGTARGERRTGPVVASGEAGFTTTLAAVETRTEGKAVASLVLGISGLLLLGVVFGPIAIIVGWLSLSRIKASGGLYTGKGMAIAGVILGAVDTIAGLLLMVTL